MRTATVITAVCLSVVGLAAGPDARAVARHYDLNIPKQSLDLALRDLAQQTGLQIALFSDAIDESALVGPILGSQSAEQALRTLLTPSGLSYKVVSEGTIAVLNAKDAPAAAGPRAAAPAEEESGARLEEIIVTAQKRQERIQDVPIPVTAIQATTLLESNQLRLQDYYTRIPGLSVTPSAYDQTIAIRGITTGPATNPTVGITVDDVPFGASTSLGGGNVVPDLDPSDLARIEVLRGPQGTLYGASSLGGLIKFVTVDPSTDRVSGRVEGGTQDVKNGDGLGYSVRGSVNLPVSDAMAIRASGFTREDPGYIDNPSIGAEGVNQRRVKGGRVSTLWRPSDTYSLKLSALYQDYESDGASEVNTTLNELQQNYIRGTGPSQGNAQAYSGTFTGQFGNLQLVALSGYNTRENQDAVDFSESVGGLLLPLYGVDGASLNTHGRTRKFTQELRLSGSIGTRVDWLVGAIYSHEQSDVEQDIPAIDPATGRVVAISYHSPRSETNIERAAFSNLTLHFNDRFDVQIGGRMSGIRQKFQQTTVQPIFTNGSEVPDIGPTTYASADPVTYLLTPRFRISPELMLYARAASGYRVGGPNGALCTARAFPCEFGPDKTRNYEIGAKGALLSNRLAFDASVYSIDWDAIQLFVTDPSYISYNTNASGARSRGVELSIEARPSDDVAITAWATWSDPELTRALPPGAPGSAPVAGPGERLPYSSRFSSNVSFDWTVPLGSLKAILGGSLSYSGDRLGTFVSAGERQEFAAYTRADLRVGLVRESWTLNVFANNVFDKRARLNTGPAASTFIYIQPRTVGVNLAKTFAQ